MRRALAVARAVTGAAALAAAGVAAAGLVASQAQPPSEYPSTPRAADGSNPFANLPRPRECAPSRDRPARRDYFPLRRMRAERRDNPYVLGEPFNLRLTLQNVKRQQFHIHVSGTQTTVRRFIESSSACLERFTLPGAVPALIEPIGLGPLLVVAAVTESGRSQAALSVARDQLEDSGLPASLADVLASLGVATDAVVESAAAAAQSALDAKVAAGEIPAAEAASANLQAMLAALAAEAGAPFLFAPSEQPSTPAAYGVRLKANPRTEIVVSMQTVSPPRTPFVVWFLFDPPINEDGIHNYRAECRMRAWTRIRATVGSSRVKLWRVPLPQNPGTATATAPSYSATVQRSSTTKKYYDVNVKGLQDGSNYSIEGGWVQTTGSGQC